MRYIDMHTHSSASDGELSPALLAKAAHDVGLCAVAICDHDTGAGISEFMESAEKYSLEGIPSVEISVDFKCEMHILGFYVDYKSEKFNSMCRALRAFRRERNETTSRLLAKQGINIPVPEAESFASGDVCGRLHFALAMTKHGFVNSVDEAFALYLGSGKCAYNSAQLYSPRETIEKLTVCGARPVLAHPIHMNLNNDETFSVLKELKTYGLYGVECLYNSHTPEYEAFIKSSADKLGLKITGGSDFHGKNKPKVHIGKIYNDRPIPYEILENFKNT